MSSRENRTDDFAPAVRESLGRELQCQGVSTLQVNVGLRCNQTCSHCHLSCGPERSELMGRGVMEAVCEAADACQPELVDITGGAPELNPDLLWLVQRLRELGHPVQVRTNLTALLEPGGEGIAGFYAGSGVRLVASMPCYLEQNVRAQRGAGVYEQSVRAIKLLNRLGYGREPGLRLDLVYNPGGPALPPDQRELEADYRREFGERFGLRFNSLLTIVNMPIGRFLEALRSEGCEEAYRRSLAEEFNPATVEDLMCRHQVTVGWDGTLYDCDFNLALDRPVDAEVPGHVSSFSPQELASRRVVTGRHCFGCTAGAGSSCSGALV